MERGTRLNRAKTAAVPPDGSGNASESNTTRFTILPKTLSAVVRRNRPHGRTPPMGKPRLSRSKGGEQVCRGSGQPPPVVPQCLTIGLAPTASGRPSQSRHRASPTLGSSSWPSRLTCTFLFSFHGFSRCRVLWKGRLHLQAPRPLHPSGKHATLTQTARWSMKKKCTACF